MKSQITSGGRLKMRLKMKLVKMMTAAGLLVFSILFFSSRLIEAESVFSDASTPAATAAAAVPVNTFTIGGSVRADGANLAGATVVLSGSQSQTATTDAAGNYSFTAEAGGSYTISVYKNGFTFDPASQTLTNLQANQTADFQTGVPLCAPQPRSLVAWYKAENNGNDTANGLNGSISNIGFGAGKSGLAFYTAGSQYFSVPDHSNLRTTELSVAGWFRMTSVPAGGQFYTLASKYGGDFRGWILRYTSDQKASFEVYRPSTGAAVASSTIPLNTWVHIAATYDGANLKIYVNGVLSSASTFPGGYALSLSSVPFQIGKASWYNGEYSHAHIDEFQYFYSPLSAAEIQSIYNAGSAGVCASGAAFTPTFTNGKIAFQSGSGGIAAIDTSGSNLTTITSNLQDSSPSYSPDGNKIVFSKSTPNGSSGNINIFVMNADGSNQTQLTNYTTGSIQATHPTWSPDGTKIAFKVNTGLGGIVVMNANGTNPVTLSGVQYVDSYPKWSPDGSKIMFVTLRNINIGKEITVVNADGSNQIDLTGNNSDDTAPNWSPDGSKIVFASRRTGKWQIFVMNANGSNQANISNNSFDDNSPVWSPDGAFIAFTSRRSGNFYDEIYKMNASGNNISQLTFFRSGHDLSWQRTATNILIAPVANVSLNFSNISQAGFTVANALTSANLPALPAGYSLLANSAAYDIRTSAQYSGNIAVTFNVPNIANAQTCARLRSLHYETNGWTTNANATPNYNSQTQVCSVSQTVSSLSPFVVAQLNSYTISGQITAGGNPLAGVSVALSGATNASTTTDASGNYSFANLTALENYTVTPALQNYAFTPASAVFGNLSANGTANFAAAPQNINVSIPNNLTALKNTALNVPLNVGNTSGGGVIAYDFRITYDPVVLTPLAVPFDKAGTMSAGFEVAVNASTPGVLIVSGFGANPLTGSGTLLNLKFNAVGNISSCGALQFTAFQFNEGEPHAVTSNGQACVIAGEISGTIVYGTSETSVSVPNVALTAAGTPNVSAATAADGAYALTGLGAGAYTVTPSKTGEANNAVSALDASLISQFVIGSITFNANQQTAADTSGNGSITSYDAGLTAQYVVGLSNPDSRAGTWKFVPVSREYPNVEANQTNQNYTAILMGEVSGNWTPPAAVAESEQSQTELANAVAVSLPTMTAARNRNITLPVTVGDVTGRNVLAYQFDVVFDPAVLQPQAAPVVQAETLSANFTVVANAQTPGRLRVAAFGTQALAGQGTLLKLNFRVVGQAGSNTDLTWQGLQFNESQPPAAGTAGRISVTASASSQHAYDFDGDGKADISVFRPENGVWYQMRSTEGFAAAQFGISTDKLAPADFDGDGKTDLAVFRDGIWYLLRSQAGFASVQFGIAGDIPQPADFDGDGRAEISVYRGGHWFVLNLANGQFSAGQFGVASDKPVVADYDGDGKADYAVYRPANGVWYLLRSTEGFGAAQFGISTDKPVVGDYDGDGKADQAVYRDGTWYLNRSRDGFAAAQFGIATDVPVPADYDGDGKTDLAVYRSGNWYLLQTTSGFAAGPFGISTDKPVPNAFVP